ncbi:MAG: sigma-E factor negative regulatory protein [Pseudomonadota bacterium]
MKKNEIISALADGQLQGQAFDEAVALAADDDASREAWHRYHLIGDVLRSGEHAGATQPSAFLGKLQVRLRHERALPVAETQPAPAIAVKAMPAERARAATPAANDSSFRWKLVAGFASVTAVAAIGWSMVAGLQGTAGAGAQLASAPPSGPVVASVPGGTGAVMLRDPKLDEFMAAHRQLGGASALQMPAGFLRNATYEGTGR